MHVLIPVAPGELIDKITILEVKAARIDAAKRANVEAELALLCAARDGAIAPSEALDALTRELAGVNAALWDIEDAKRACERTQDFGAQFIELARAVYRENDRRAAVKRRINELLGSSIFEEKSYKPY